MAAPRQISYRIRGVDKKVSLRAHDRHTSTENSAQDQYSEEPIRRLYLSCNSRYLTCKTVSDVLQPDAP